MEKFNYSISIDTQENTNSTWCKLDKMGEIGVFLHPHTQALRRLGAIYQASGPRRLPPIAMTLVNSRETAPRDARRGISRPGRAHHLAAMIID